MKKILLVFAVIALCSHAFASEIFKMADSGTPDTVRIFELLDSNVYSVNAQQPGTGNTLLHIAAANGNLGLTHALMLRGAPLLARNNAGQNPFQYAQARGVNDQDLLNLIRPGEDEAAGEYHFVSPRPPVIVVSESLGISRPEPVGTEAEQPQKRARTRQVLPARFRIAFPENTSSALAELISRLTRLDPEIAAAPRIFTNSQIQMMDDVREGLPRALQLRHNLQLGYGVFAREPIEANRPLGFYTGRYSFESQNFGPPPPHSRYAFGIRQFIELQESTYAALRAEGLIRSRNLVWNEEERFVLEIDAGNEGNWLRFVNHSDDANLDVIMALVRDPHTNEVHVLPLFVPNRPIAAGEQLTIDYGDEYWSDTPNAKISLSDYDFDENVPDFDD